MTSSIDSVEAVQQI